MAQAAGEARAVRRGTRRAVLFRAVAVLLGLMPLIASEVLFTALDWGRPSLQDDPFVGFSAWNPLFVPSEDGTRYEVAPAHYKFFRPESFPARKPPGAFRIFCLGGSSVQGRPFGIETSFTTWLELSLRAADPSHPWDVVNCGGVSYASYRLVPILQEVLGHQADLIVLYTGHNEFLEDRTYRHIKEIPAVVRRPLEVMARLRTFGVAAEAVRRLSGRAGPSEEGRTLLGPEVQALLDYRGGLEAYHRDDDWRRGVVAHYEFNLRRMIALCRAAGVPVLLVNPPSNLDHPPFKSEHRAGLSDEQAAEFSALWDEARSLYGRDLREAVRRLRAACDLDDQHAGLLYTLAKCYQDQGRSDEALAEFERARDEDICPLRIPGPMNRIVLEVGRQTGTPVLDLVALFAHLSPGGIAGSDWFVDHVHPSIAGHQRIAAELLALMVRCGSVRTSPGWEGRRDRLFRDQLDGLDDFYYLKGQKRLKNLQMWAAGLGNLPWPGLNPRRSQNEEPPGAIAPGAP